MILPLSSFLATCFFLASCLAYSLTLKMETVYSRMVKLDQTAQCYTPEDSILQNIIIYHTKVYVSPVSKYHHLPYESSCVSCFVVHMKRSHHQDHTHKYTCTKRNSHWSHTAKKTNFLVVCTLLFHLIAVDGIWQNLHVFFILDQTS
jgi:hypothetical protein